MADGGGGGSQWEPPRPDRRRQRAGREALKNLLFALRGAEADPAQMSAAQGHRAWELGDDGVLYIAAVNEHVEEETRRRGLVARWAWLAAECGIATDVLALTWQYNAGQRKLRAAREREVAPVPAEEESALVGEARPSVIGWLHAILAQVGLPRSLPKGADGSAAREFGRVNGAVAMRVTAGGYYDRRFGLHEVWVPLPMPYGSQPRLMLADICTWAVRNQSREVDLGRSVRDYLTGRLAVQGISAGAKGTYTSFKKQAMALAGCRMQLQLNYDGRMIVYKGEPIRSFQAWAAADDQQMGLWPGTLRLDEDFFQTLLELEMPIDMRAYRSLMRSPMAMDAYTWLAHRMWRVDRSVDIRWEALHRDMGQEYKNLKNFKWRFRAALKAAQGVYPQSAGRIEETATGIRLYEARPPVPFLRAPRRWQ